MLIKVSYLSLAGLDVFALGLPKTLRFFLRRCALAIFWTAARCRAAVLQALLVVGGRPGGSNRVLHKGLPMAGGQAWARAPPVVVFVAEARLMELGTGARRRESSTAVADFTRSMAASIQGPMAIMAVGTVEVARCGGSPVPTVLGAIGAWELDVVVCRAGVAARPACYPLAAWARRGPIRLRLLFVPCRQPWRLQWRISTPTKMICWGMMKGDSNKRGSAVAAVRRKIILRLNARHRYTVTFVMLIMSI